MSDIDIVRTVDRPDLLDAVWDLDPWPAFAHHDPHGDLYYSQFDAWPDHAFIALTPDGRLAAKAFSVPFAMGEDLGRPGLPTDGWDGVIRWAWLDQLADRPPTHVSALEVSVHPEYRGTGLAARMLGAMKDAARARDLGALVAPVRPTRKALEPGTSMAEYAARTGEDGLPTDPWLRTHAQMGAEIVAVAPRSMTITGTLDDWRGWTGLPFDRSGSVAVEGALSLVHVDVDQDVAVYIEPNVWMRHAV